MHDYLLSAEWVRFAFVFGIAVSMVLYEKRHLTTGSIVVPGYIAVFILHPLVVLATFLNSLITYAVVNKFLTKHFLLYGRTKFTVLAVISTAIQTAMLRVSPSGNWLWEADIPIFIGVGYIIPALIAHDMARQGIKKTFRSVMVAALIVVVPIATALLLDLPGVNDLSPVAGFGSSAVSLEWLPFAIVLSVLASWAVAENYGWRSGGFVGAAFVGTFMADPWQVVAAVSIATATYLIVAKFLMRHMILFGRRKFSSMLLVSSTIAWSGLWVGDRFLNATWEQHLGVGSLALTPLMLPGFLANDAQRTSPWAVVRGVCLAGTFAVTTTWWVESLVTGASLHAGWKLVSAATFGALYHKQVALAVRSLRARGSAEVDEALVPAVAASTTVQAELTLVPELVDADSPADATTDSPADITTEAPAATTEAPAAIEHPAAAALTPYDHETETETETETEIAAAGIESQETIDMPDIEHIATAPAAAQTSDIATAPAAAETSDIATAPAAPAAAGDDRVSSLFAELRTAVAEARPDSKMLGSEAAPAATPARTKKPKPTPDLVPDLPAVEPAAAAAATPRQPAEHVSFDMASSLILEEALLADRGMRKVPRRHQAVATIPQISETSDAQREAQLRASDVSDNPLTVLATPLGVEVGEVSDPHTITTTEEDADGTIVTTTTKTVTTVTTVERRAHAPSERTLQLTDAE